MWGVKERELAGMTEGFDLNDQKNKAAIDWEEGYGQSSFCKKDQELSFGNGEF